MEPDKYCWNHKVYYEPGDGCVRCTIELRALCREAYMALLASGLSPAEARLNALETVRQWDAMMEELDDQIATFNPPETPNG